ncbi:hypothetical protein L486_08215 [Kwoniella mangroviensis CBS 10435]|uniref:Cytochrome b5 heme-binding domain-containing protein n=1 Tax=Kwoniella mangroviensis CBS 10435 TaxID=1331196 RepID=A0A1B9IFT9_9TREE|nr:hypothetical protein L486_08215 [Kwoniella mangroviensis CBS 10435]
MSQPSSGSWYETLTSTPVLIATAVGVSFAAIFAATSSSSNTTQQVKEQVKEVKNAAANAADAKGKAAQAGASIMSAPAADLAPPKDDPIPASELSQFDGSDPSKPIYVAIKGRVFDVSNKAEMYGKGRGYNIFAGRDASKGLGMSSLDLKDAVPDYSSLNESQLNTLNQWESFFEKRYNIVGKVVP